MTSRLKDTADLLTCPVCLELYNDPYILPCSHVLCRSCIEGVKQNKNTFGCPECQQVVKLDSSGIDGLERDRRTALMVEAAARATNRQTIKREKKAEQCEKHKLPQEIYCKTCNILVCKKCGVDGGHDGHSMFEAELAADKGRQWINVMLEQITEYHTDASKQIKQCENHTTAIKANASNLWHQMEETFGKIKADLQRREVELSNWLQEQVETCETINRTFITAFKDNIERLNGFMQQLQISMREETAAFVKSFGATKKRVLDFLENEKNRKHPTCYPGDALSNIEFKYAPWRLKWPDNIQDITIEGSIKYQKEHTETREQTTSTQTTNLEVIEIHRRLLAKSKSVRTAMEKLLIKENATIEWPFDFKNDIKIISQKRQQRKNFKQDIMKTVSGFLRQFQVREIDFNEVGFKWVKSQVEFVEKEMQSMGDNFALIWSANDVTIIGVAAKLNQLVTKLKSLMSSK